MAEKMNNSFESANVQKDIPTVQSIMNKHFHILSWLPFKRGKDLEFNNLIAKIIIQSSTTEAFDDLKKDIDKKFYAPSTSRISYFPMMNVGIIRNDKWLDTTVMSINLLTSFFDIRYNQAKENEDIIYLRKKIASFMSAVYKDYRLQKQK